MPLNKHKTDEGLTRCGCKIICDCSKYKDECDCDCGSPFTCNECQKRLDDLFEPIKGNDMNPEDAI